MQFQQIRSATSIVTFADKRFLIDPMLAPANTYPIVPDAPVCGKGNPTIDLPCKPQDLFGVDAIIVTHWHFDHFDQYAMELLPKNIPLFTQNTYEAQLCRLDHRSPLARGNGGYRLARGGGEGSQRRSLRAGKDQGARGGVSRRLKAHGQLGDGKDALILHYRRGHGQKLERSRHRQHAYGRLQLL